MDVRRRVRIDMKYCDLDGVEKTERITGIQARIIQHELDHLDGVRNNFSVLVAFNNIFILAQILLVDKICRK